MPEPLLKINGLSVAFSDRVGLHEVVSAVSLEVNRGEVLALVGESGSGKTVTALSCTRLLPSPPAHITEGSVIYRGQDLLQLPERELQNLRGGRIAYVFQEPSTALNPVFTAGYQIAEALRRHGIPGDERENIFSLLDSVGIRDCGRVSASYPHQLSGGQQQRVMLAIALACNPELLIADEPTTALDVTVQAQILKLLMSIQHDRGLTILLITHNLGIAANIADRIAVMYAGQVVECGPARQVVDAPAHPYTRALLQAVPRLKNGAQLLEGIPGTIPAGVAWPQGCRFHPRCSLMRDTCAIQSPPVAAVPGERISRCHFWSEVHTS